MGEQRMKSLTYVPLWRAAEPLLEPQTEMSQQDWDQYYMTTTHPTAPKISRSTCSCCAGRQARAQRRDVLRKQRHRSYKRVSTKLKKAGIRYSRRKLYDLTKLVFELHTRLQISRKVQLERKV